MKVKQHGNRFRIDYRCPNFPKLIHESFDTKEEAELRLAQIKLEKKRGTLLPPPELVDPDADRGLYRETITVRQLMEEYVQMYGLNHWSESTLSCNQHRIDDYIIPYMGDVPIKTLTTHRLEKFYRQLLKEPAVKMKGREQEERTISFSVVEKVHSILRSALNQAIRWDYLRGANPAMAVELPRHKKHRRDAWTDQEAYEALALCTDPVLKLCLYLALGCSMRIGEILGLTWSCVHMDEELLARDEAYVYVEKELRRCEKDSLVKLKEQNRDDVFFTFPEYKKTGCSTSLVLKSPKTESSVRIIYLPRAVSDALKEAKLYQEDLKRQLCGAYLDFDLVVAHDSGRPVEEHIIGKKLKTLIQKHNLRPVVFHSLRHSSTSLKLKISGGDIKSVQGDTGHSQSNMVTDVYSHIVDADRRHLARKMDEHFFRPPQKAKEAADQPPMDESMKKLMDLLKNSPNIAGPLLQMSQILGNGNS
jgi:integrase